MIINSPINSRNTLRRYTKTKLKLSESYSVWTQPRPRTLAHFPLTIGRSGKENWVICGHVFGVLVNVCVDVKFLFYPIRNKTKTNHDALAQVFPPFASATCPEFWLVLCIVCTISDWLERFLWFWFYDTQLETALLVEKITVKQHMHSTYYEYLHKTRDLSEMENLHTHHSQVSLLDPAPSMETVY